MRKYRSDANSEVRVVYGIDLSEGLQQFPESVPLATTIQAQNEQLDRLRRNRELAERKMPSARARLRFAEYNYDSTVRTAARGLEVSDGGRRSVLYKAIFPDRIADLVRSSGESQLKLSSTFIARIKASNAAGIEPWREQWVPRIEEAHAKLEAAVKARAAAYAEVGAARVLEEAAREAHSTIVDKLMGEVRALFPRDRKRWDVIFPPAPRSSTTAADDNDPEPTEPEQV